MTPASQKKLLKFFVGIFLAIITSAAFAGLAHCDFITLDDRVYVVANPAVQHGFSWAAIKWAFSSFHAGYWLPLTWLSHTLDCQLFGLHPAGHHLMNLAFHLANVLLLFLLVEKWTAKLWPAAFVALLFAIHPMHVESVAWIAERKDVLSACFFLLTLLAYTRYANMGSDAALSRVTGVGAASAMFQAIGRIFSLSQREREGVRENLSKKNPVPLPGKAENPHVKSKAWPFYGLALLLFALGLMAKPMLVTLPFILLLLDYWPLQRFGASRFKPILLEKIPFFLVTALFCALTWFTQNAIGSVKSASAFSPLQRLAHVPVSYAWYVLKLFWPANLSVFYPLPANESLSLVLFASLFLVILTILALACIRQCPAVFIGWFWFIIMLLPVIGLLQAGDQAYADRFTYLPYIGLFLSLAFGIPNALASSAMSRRRPVNLPAKKTKRQLPPLPAGEGRGEGELNKQLIKTSSGLSARPRQILLWSGAILIAAACFWRTVVEVQYWKDGITLLNRAIALDPQNDMAWMSLGSEYYNRGNYARAIDYMTRATTLNPSSNLAWHFLGKLLARNGDNAGAQNAYQTSLQYASFNGDRKDTYNDLGDSFASAGQYDQAVAAYQSSLQLSPDQPDTQVKIGQCFLQIQSADQADAAFQAALDLQPDNSDAHAGLGMILQSQGRDADAITHYRQALAASPDSLLALNNLAWLLATDSDPTLRNGPQAVTLAKRACEQTHYQKAFLIGTLAAAYAEAGQFDDAIAAAQKARDVATTNGETDLAARNTQLLKLYQSHHPFHQP